MRFVSFLFIIFLLSTNIYSQKTNELILVSDTLYKNEDSYTEKYIILIRIEKKYKEILTVFAYKDNFKNIFTTKNYSVYKYYNDSTGDTTLYFVFSEMGDIYKISYFEYEIPLSLYDIDNDNVLKFISFKEGNCGKIIDKKLQKNIKLDSIVTHKKIPINYCIVK